MASPTSREDPDPLVEASSSSLRRVIISAALGQFVEWYDFVIYAYSAVIIARLFFPSEDPVAGVLAVFGVYAVGFLMRPLGGIVFGILGDRMGRRQLLVIVIVTMGAATLGIGLLPTYGQVGVLAPLLLILCRMVQGFAAAGETVGSNAFVAEHAPKGKRGLYVAFTYSFSTVPSVAAALFVLFLTNTLGEATYDAWGWRIAFLVGGPMALIGLYIRTKVDESPVYEAAQAAQAAQATEEQPQERVQSTRPAVVRTIALAALASLGFYTLSGYFVTFLTTGANLPSSDALLSNGIALSISFLAFWVGGALSDRWGRRPVLFTAIWAVIVLYLPALWLASLGTFASALAGQAVIGMVFGVYWGVFGVTVIELFPTRNRLSGATISWNLAYTVFGGTAPLLATWLIDRTGSLVSPGIYMMAIAFIAFLCVRSMPETAGSNLLHEQDRSRSSRSESI